jgi:hypothetical protein
MLVDINNLQKIKALEVLKTNLSDGERGSEQFIFKTLPWKRIIRDNVTFRYM